MNKTLVVVIALLAVGGIAYALSSTNDDTMKNTDVAMEKKIDTRNTSDTTMNNDVVSDESAGVMVGGALMVPNLDIVENAMKAKNVNTLVAAVSAAGLVDTLKSEGPFTVFAPNNEAFAALPAGTVETLLKPENKADLVNILTYHVVPGRYTASDLKDGMQLTTVQGQKLTIGKMGANITINGKAMVETADVISSNGVIFVVDSVLLPSTE